MQWRDSEMVICKTGIERRFDWVLLVCATPTASALSLTQALLVGRTEDEPEVMVVTAKRQLTSYHKPLLTWSLSQQAYLVSGKALAAGVLLPIARPQSG